MNIIDQRATKIGVVVVNKATSFPCKYLKALIKQRYIIPNWIIPIKKALIFFLSSSLMNGKNIKQAINNLKKTTCSLGIVLKYVFVNPNDNEKQIVAKTK